MLVANPVIGMPHRVERDLPILMRQRDQLASRMFFRRAAFVGIDMRILAAQHRVIWPVQSLQPEHIRTRSVERKKNVDPLAEVFFEFCNRRTRVGIVAVRHNVTLVGPGNRLQNLRMHPGIVVAGKVAGRLVRGWRHKK
jgi:hypothetical protein